MRNGDHLFVVFAFFGVASVISDWSVCRNGVIRDLAHMNVCFEFLECLEGLRVVDVFWFVVVCVVFEVFDCLTCFAWLLFLALCECLELRRLFACLQCLQMVGGMRCDVCRWLVFFLLV